MEFETEAVLESAMRLFWTHGYQATSTAMLMEAMGLSKSSLYKTFHSKSALFELCIDRYTKMRLGELEILRDAAPDTVSFVRRLLERVVENAAAGRRTGGVEGAKASSCLLVNTTCELSGVHPEFGAAVDGGLDRIAGILEEALQHGVENGELRSDTEVPTLALYLFNSWCGLAVMATRGVSPARLQSIVDMAMNTLEAQTP